MARLTDIADLERPDDPPSAAAAPILEMVGVTKSFGPVTVVRDIDIALYPGEVHALLGENGAGKSTLMKILSGIISTYEGTLRIDGEPVRFESVRDAQARGIAIIHQELNLVADMTVAENIFLGREPRIGGILVDGRTLNRNAKALLDRLGVALGPNRRVGALRVGERQLVEIAKALSLNARVLIMDEPTSALSQPECERLFGIVEQLAASGVAIVYISHRMDEIERLADRVTILRDGRRAATGETSAFTPASLIAHMVGRDVVLAPPARPAEDRPVVLSVSGLGLRATGPRAGRSDLIHDVSFDVREGEILGVGGLLGAGRSEILETIFGAARGEACGTIAIDGRRVSIANPCDAVAHGLAFVTEDRKATGLLLASTIRDNLTLPSLPALGRFGVRSAARETRLAAAGIADLHVRCRDAAQTVRELSGGNQQKVVIGKWLATGPRVLLLDEPTRGIDVGAKQEIYDLIFRLAADGLAIVVVTSELPELLLLSDRILVMCEGRQTGILSRSEATEETVMTLASPRGSRLRPHATAEAPCP